MRKYLKQSNRRLSLSSFVCIKSYRINLLSLVFFAIASLKCLEEHEKQNACVFLLRKIKIVFVNYSDGV